MKRVFVATKPLNGSLSSRIVASMLRSDAIAVPSAQDERRCRQAGVTAPIFVVPRFGQVAKPSLPAMDRPPYPPQPHFTSGDVCGVVVGHRGDCLNIFPILEHLHQQGMRVFLSAPECCQDLLDDRVPYITPCLPNRGHMIEARREARKHFRQVLQLHLDALDSPRSCSSWTVEMWYVAGYLDYFHLWPLTIGRRERLPRRGQIGVNVTSALTSPFAAGQRLLDELERAFPGRILDLGRMRKKSLLDLLPVIDSCEAFVSIATGTLHLAAASETPLVALVEDEVAGDLWRVVQPRFCAATIKYSDAALCPQIVIGAVRRLIAAPPNPMPLTPSSPTPVYYSTFKKRLRAGRGSTLGANPSP